MTKVLILDQSKSVRNILRERLEYEGFSAEAVENEAAASALCERIPFDVILSDTECKVPDAGIPFIALSADTSIDTASAEASGTPEAPAAGAFSLTVTGETGTQKWDTLTEFEQSQTVFRMGAYTVAIAHGDPDAEGAGKPTIMPNKRSKCCPGAR